MKICEFEIIFYVFDQKKSRDFYSKLFDMAPSLDVDGMTEFTLSPQLKFGLMPEHGIAKIIGDKVMHPMYGNGIPRCELYLVAENIERVFKLALELDAMEISPIQDRDWGHRVGYVADFDRNIIAFAEKIE